MSNSSGLIAGVHLVVRIFNPIAVAAVIEPVRNADHIQSQAVNTGTAATTTGQNDIIVVFQIRKMGF